MFQDFIINDDYDDVEYRSEVSNCVVTTLNNKDYRTFSTTLVKLRKV